MRTIEIPADWTERYTIPSKWGTFVRPEQIVIEDDKMEADAIVLVGWVVFSEEGPNREYLVGTVIRQQINGVIEDIESHGHVYIKRLDGRRIVSCRQYEGPFEVKVIR